MCGLVGIAGDINSKEQKMFRDMLICNAIRGLDSAGIALVSTTPNASPIVEKAVGATQNLWDWGVSKEMCDRGLVKKPQKVMVGHNRAATFGEVTEENAHPFVFDHITGVHNGSLIDWRDLEGYTEFDVDSMAIFKTIAEKGIDHCWKNFTGAAALVWWDEKEETLNLIHNNQRPLFVAWSKDEKTIFWSSEDWIISGLAKKHKIDLREDTKEKPNLFELKEHYLHVFKPTATTCPLVEVRELEKKKMSTVWRVGRGPIGGRFSYYKYIPPKESKTKYKVRRKSPIINTWWAEDCAKADKSMRGKVFEVLSSVDSIKGGRPFKYLLCQTEDGDRLEIYPDRLEEFEQYVDALKKGEVLGVITERPRIEILKGDKVDVVAYKVSSRGVQREFNLKSGKEALYKSFRGARVTKDEWTVAVEMSNKGDCAWCGNPLDIAEHEEHEWMDSGDILCGPCSKDVDLKKIMVNGSI